MDDRARTDGRTMPFDESSKDKMTVPERIVLSAGYDGDDNEESTVNTYGDAFDETPILNPSNVLGGMQTPPSILTIDHSSNMFRNSPNWHTEGDGADDSESKHFKYSKVDDDQDDDFAHDRRRPERSIVIAGQEDYLNHHVPTDDPRAMQQWYTSMQRRLTILENEQEYQKRVSNVWKYFLLTLTVINPIILHYFFSNRRH